MLSPYAIIILCIKTFAIYALNTKINETDTYLHLENKNITKICGNRDLFCKSNNTNICAIRMFFGRRSYMDYENGCYLFMSNMCDNPGQEYYIATSGSCSQYLVDRRSDDVETTENALDYETTTITEYGEELTTEDGDGTTIEGMENVTEHSILRTKTTKFVPLYDVDSSYDGHLCPQSCPRSYSPVCVNVNRGFGKYFKLLMFVNHCESDIYYCKHWREFEPPPDEDESIQGSPLSWSFCGASRYMSFARFSEVLSALGHYGWLAGDYRYSHIMEPHQRIPGYGKK